MGKDIKREPYKEHCKRENKKPLNISCERQFPDCPAQFNIELEQCKICSLGQKKVKEMKQQEKKEAKQKPQTTEVVRQTKVELVELANKCANMKTEGLKPKEIAEKLNMKASKVRQLLRKAKKQNTNSDGQFL